MNKTYIKYFFLGFTTVRVQKKHYSASQEVRKRKAFKTRIIASYVKKIE